MTREEAITVLKAFMENPLFSEVHKAAFNIAIHDIKAYQDWSINNLVLINKDDYEPLEQEPTTKNDLGVDCISRAEAIRVASGYCHPSNVAKELAKLPSMGRYDPYTDKFIKE